VLLPFQYCHRRIGQPGRVQNFKPYTDAKLVEPYTTQVPKTDDKGQPVNGPDGKPVMVDQKVETQSIPVGPAASQIAIKQLGNKWRRILRPEQRASIRESKRRSAIS